MSTYDIPLPAAIAEQLPTGAMKPIETLFHNFRGKTTLDEILHDETFLDAVGRDGEISGPQKAAVTATVAILQDRVIQLLESVIHILHNQLQVQNKNLLLVLGTGIWTAALQVWKAPMFSVPGLMELPAQTPGSSKPKPVSGLSSIVTWGNFFAVAAIVLAGVATYFTQAYSSYKDLADSRKQRLEERNTDVVGLKQENARLQKEKSDADTNSIKADALAKALQTQLDEANQNRNVSGTDAQKTIQELNDKLRLAAVGEAEMKGKYEGVNKEMLQYRQAYTDAANRATVAEKARDKALEQLALVQMKRGAVSGSNSR